MTDTLINGEAGGTISANDRGLLYGDGLFETIAVRGGVPRFFDYHLERLRDGCARLGIAPPGEELLHDEARLLLAGRRDATLRITLTRGVGPRGYAPTADAPPTRILSIGNSRPVVATAYSQGVVVRLCATPIGIDPAVAGMKTLNRLDQVLARGEWSDPDITEGLMLTHRGQVICGTMSNVFYVTHGRLFTPDLSLCGIRGVMRRVVMEQAAKLRYDCVESVVDPQGLYRADEVFVTNSQFGIWPVRQLDTTTFVLGPVTRALMAALRGIGVEECPA